MEIILRLIDFILHVDRYVGSLIQSYGVWTYLILFLIILAETGLVITPFLPGDSLIFITGVFAAQGGLNVFLLFFLLSSAAVIGDTLNYWIGSYFGEKVFAKNKLFKREYLERTKEFYKKHGGKAIILARFIPIIRTFAPFVAGIGKMDYLRFLGFNLFGGIVWVAIFVFAGYFFGNISFVKENLALITYIMIFLSIIPVILEFIKDRRKDKKS